MMKLIGSFALLLCATAAPAQMALRSYTSADDFAGTRWLQGAETLNLTGYAKVVEDNFDACDIGEDPAFRGTSLVFPQVGGHNWYWTPEGQNPGSTSGYGYAKFTKPSDPNSPYSCSDGTIKLKVSNPSGSQWLGGIMSAESSSHEGLIFARLNPAYSYWEARILLPPAPAGMVPGLSYWFRGNSAPDRGRPSFMELDVFESGLSSAVDLSVQATTIHEWPGTNPLPGEITAHRSASFGWNINNYDGAWHTYGALRTPNWWVIYIDGKELKRFRSLGFEMQRPMYPIFDFTVHYNPTSAASVTWTAQIDYLRLYTCTPVTPEQTIACER